MTSSKPIENASPSLPNRRSRIDQLLEFGNLRLWIGLSMVLGLAAYGFLGLVFYDTDLSRPLSAPIGRAPSIAYPFGTDMSGRDLFGVSILGTLITLKVGVLAGSVAVGFATFVAFTSAYLGGWTDRVVRSIVDILLTVPGLLVLIVLASSFEGELNTTTMAIVIACLAWREPTRQIRAQVLVMREANYLRMARMSGVGPMSIIVFEMIPNLMPYLGASLLAAVSGAVLASVGLEALGLGSPSEPTLGMTIYWVMAQGAFILGMWWWILMPVAVLVYLFIGLYLVTIGLDELANPRLRRRR